MNAFECLTTRRSTRKFSTKALPEGTAEKIVEAAHRAATANNKQPWLFVCVTEQARRKAVKELCPNNGPYIEVAPLCVAVFCRNDNKYFLEDGSAATQNILNAAHALGLGAVWVAGDKKDYCDPIRKYLNVPEEYRLISLVPVGYPSEATALTERKPLSEVFFMESYR